MDFNVFHDLILAQCLPGVFTQKNRSLLQRFFACVTIETSPTPETAREKPLAPRVEESRMNKIQLEWNMRIPIWFIGRLAWGWVYDALRMCFLVQFFAHVCASNSVNMDCEQSLFPSKVCREERRGVLTIWMEFSVIPRRIQMERFIPVESFRKKQ